MLEHNIKIEEEKKKILYFFQLKLVWIYIPKHEFMAWFYSFYVCFPETYQCYVSLQQMLKLIMGNVRTFYRIFKYCWHS